MQTEDGKTLNDLQAEHLPPPRGRIVMAEEHEQSPWRNYIRDLVLGLNDGIVSVYALVAGVAGAAFSAHQVAVAGVAASIAGALSMGLGEYLSTKSQSQYYAAEARRERVHIQTYPLLERQELREMLTAKHYPPGMIEEMVEHLAASEDRFVDFMMREEFGVGKESDRSAISAMLLISGAFLVGAVLPVAPYFIWAGKTALLASSILALGGLLVAGAVKGRISGLSIWRSGFEMAALGALAAGVTYLVGKLFHAV